MTYYMETPDGIIAYVAPKPLLPHGRSGVLLLCAGLMACATGDTSKVANPDASSAGTIAPQVLAAPIPVEPQRPRIDLSKFVGGDARDLEKLTGAPALVHEGGAFEFRRYNLNDCRVMAVVTADGNGAMQVSKVDVADKRASGPARDINSCL